MLAAFGYQLETSVWSFSFSCTSTVASQMFPTTISTANHNYRRCQERFFLYSQCWQDWAWWHYTCLARGKELHFIPFLKVFRGNTLPPPSWHRACKCKADCPALLSAAICTSLSACISCWQPLLHSVLLLVITQNSHSMAVCSLETHVN